MLWPCELDGLWLLVVCTGTAATAAAAVPATTAQPSPPQPPHPLPAHPLSPHPHPVRVQRGRRLRDGLRVGTGARLPGKLWVCIVLGRLVQLTIRLPGPETRNEQPVRTVWMLDSAVRGPQMHLCRVRFLRPIQEPRRRLLLRLPCGRILERADVYQGRPRLWVHAEQVPVHRLGDCAV